LSFKFVRFEKLELQLKASTDKQMNWQVLENLFVELLKLVDMVHSFAAALEKLQGVR
jgi:hypothetical protein